MLKKGEFLTSKIIFNLGRVACAVAGNILLANSFHDTGKSNYRITGNSKKLPANHGIRQRTEGGVCKWRESELTFFAFWFDQSVAVEHRYMLCI